MKVAGWIAAILTVGLCAFVLFSEREAMDKDAEKWRAERDSLQNRLSRALSIADTSEARLHRSIAAYRDTVAMLLTPKQQDEKAQRYLDGAGLDSVLNVLDRGTGPAPKRVEPAP